MRPYTDCLLQYVIFQSHYNQEIWFIQSYQLHYWAAVANTHNKFTTRQKCFQLSQHIAHTHRYFSGRHTSVLNDGTAGDSPAVWMVMNILQENVDVNTVTHQPGWPSPPSAKHCFTWSLNSSIFSTSYY